MEKWRCSHNQWAYCKETPEWEKEPYILKNDTGATLGHSGGICKLDYKTCGRYATATELIKSIPEKQIKDNKSLSKKQ